MRRKGTPRENENKGHIRPGSGTSIPHFIREEFFFVLPLIPCKSPREYKNNSRQRPAVTLRSGLARGLTAGSLVCGQEVIPGRRNA